jgi:hypothetical protein
MIYRPAPSVAEIEQVFLAMRERPPRTQKALTAALSWLAPGPGGWCRAARRTAFASLAAADTLARQSGELPYHNRHHVAETMLAAAWLGREARDSGMITADQAIMVVVAMSGHDLGHDGTRCLTGRLEAEAAASMRLAGEQAGLDGATIDTLERLILATIPSGSAYEAVQDPLVTVVREADVLGSLLPRLGWRLTMALRREWRLAADAAAQTVASFAEREAFLLDHARPSTAANRLGLTAAVAHQVQACELAAAQLGVNGKGGAGLDALPRQRARRCYRAALAAVTST